MESRWHANDPGLQAFEPAVPRSKFIDVKTHLSCALTLNEVHKNIKHESGQESDGAFLVNEDSQEYVCPKSFQA